MTLSRLRQRWRSIAHRVPRAFFDSKDGESTVTSSKVVSTPVINRLVSLKSEGSGRIESGLLESCRPHLVSLMGRRRMKNLDDHHPAFAA
jgi:hypothetical protein